VSIRNYNAFLRAARRTGGLSLPVARKAYRKVSARLNRPAKGIDVRNHPRIFRDALSKRERAKLAATPVRKAGLAKRAAPRKPIVSRKPEPAVERKRQRVIKTLNEWQRELDLMLEEDAEYASTAQYK
jgi:hypothetical protein